MSASILPFPGALAGPCQFTTETTGALIALAAQRPRWELAFGECDDGDEWAQLCDTLNDGLALFTVAALPGGRLGIIEGDAMWPERFATGAEVVAALRDAGI